MNLEWFKEQIAEELEGAKEYAEHALEIRAMKPEWQKMFLDMSTQELEHAAKLYSMFQEYYKTVTEAYKEIPETMTELCECVDSCYTKCHTHVRWLHELAKK